MKTFALFLTIALAAPLAAAAPPQSEAPESIFGRLTMAEGASMTLELDLQTFIAEKKSGQYFPAVLKTAEGESYAVEVRARGRYRRMKAEIPPFKIRFPKPELDARGLGAHNEIKVALPMSGTGKDNDLIVKEYLAYRMFETTPGAGIRARLVRLTLRDTKAPHATPPTLLAIFVEDEEEAATRLGGTLVESYGVSTNELDLQQAALVVVFQYLIGNTDWDFGMQRNVRFVKMPKKGKILALPYDFDFSGLVNAPYASPASGTGLRDVRDRYLMAGGIPADAIRAARQTLEERKTELYAICHSPFLSQKATEQMVKFLDVFFNHLAEKDEMPVMLRM